MAYSVTTPRTPPRSDARTAAAPAEPGFVDLARLYLEGEGFEVRRSEKGRSFPGFLKAILDKDQRTLEKVYQTGYQTSRTAGVTKAAMGEESGTAGGYLVPQDFTFKLMDVISEESFIWPRANRIPMDSGEIQVPKIDVETATGSTGASPMFGGVTFKWGSGQAPTETEPKFRSMSLKAWDLLGYAIVSNQYLMDTGPQGEDALIRLFGKAAAWYAEYAFLQGSGADQLMPLGVLNAPAAIVTGGSASQNGRKTANQIVVDDIAAMAAHLLPYSWKGALWACSPTCLAQIIKISSYFINLEAHEEANVGTLLTRPVFVTDKLASLGTQGDLILFDPWLYTIGQRSQVLIDVSPHASFASFQTNFRIWLRLDGKPQVSKSITLQDNSTVVSPYVVLGPQGS